MSRRGVIGIISQMNLSITSLQSIRKKLQLGTDHARKKVWRGNEGE